MGKGRILILMLLVSTIFVLAGTLWFSESRETFDELACKFGRSEDSVWSPPFSDYTVRSFGDSLPVNVLFSITATLVTFAAAYATAKIIKAKKVVKHD